MDEGHYFNDPERGYVWGQSIFGLDPRAQLVILSATVGHQERFTHWVELTREVKMGLIDSRERKIPLEHQFREERLLDTVKDLSWKGDCRSAPLTELPTFRTACAGYERNRSGRRCSTRASVSAAPRAGA
ncbi:MAG TPA: hypothetical protein VHE35_24090 [Kofleriaceae bacterium]|nr:hypothetical protein [Kofleriaceae bacterium]